MTECLVPSDPLLHAITLSWITRPQHSFTSRTHHTASLARSLVSLARPRTHAPWPAHLLELSSDGRNIDDVLATAAVDHPNILRTLGYFTSPRLGAVLEWAPGLVSLGKPPTLETITRDTYPPNTQWSASFVLRVACGIAAALAHCHERGISHGDLYAHNILVDLSTGRSKLSDFGASFHYGDTKRTGQALHDDNDFTSHRFEAIEAKAFGVLVHDLLARTDRDDDNPSLGTLRSVGAACIGPVHSRPRFVDAVKQLRAGAGGVDACPTT